MTAVPLKFAFCLVFFAAIGAFGCGPTTTTPSTTGDASTTTPATWTDVHATLLRDCASSSCHGDRSSRGQFASTNADTAYAAVMAVSNTRTPTQSPIYIATTATTGRVMPDGRSRNIPWPGAPALLSWIEAGAENN